MLTFFIKYIYITIIVISTFFWYVVLAPIYSSIKFNSQEINDLASKIDLKKRELNKIVSIEKKVEDLGENVKKVLTVLPTESFVKEYYLELEAIVAKIGSVVSSISINDNNNGEINFNLNFVTSYENFKEFLKLIENEEKITDVQSISFSSSLINPGQQGDRDIRGYSFNVRGTAYYKK